MSTWEDMTTAERALYHASPETWPRAKVERALQHLHDWYGADWVERAADAGHPVAALEYFPGLKLICQLVDLLSFALDSTPCAGTREELMKRFRIGNSAVLSSLFEELRVMWCLLQGDFQVTKTLERTNRRTPDLLATIDHDNFFVEVTSLESTVNHRRMGYAWDRLSWLGLRFKPVKWAMVLENRSYSPRHVADLEHSILEALDEAQRTGVARLVVPDVLRYVCWRPKSQGEALNVLRELGMRNEIRGGVLDWPSRIAPFRVVQKVVDKARQIPDDNPWLLAIQAPERVWDHSDLRALDRETVEHIYDHPQLVGVILYHQWGVADLDTLNEDYRGVSVRTNRYSELDYQQTILLKNRYSDFAHKEEIWERLLTLGQSSGWEPVFP